ncbi:hypothetical protein BJX64DRAFT_293931 [Aspergillus heterothallicus]
MRSHNDYTLGWVCALPLEMTAAIAMLDETHPDLTYPSTDTNAYALGSIAGHDTVIACLPAGVYGTISAATVASHMMTTFPQIRFGLMVGIGGGVPGEGYDIRLGDVVVSRPTGTRSGVVQYDHGKAMQGGRFVLTGSMNNPPQLLLTHIALLEAEMLDHDEEFISYVVQETLEKHPHLRKRFARPEADTDVLFSAREAVPRQPRASAGPRVFYGTITSGEQVMKDSETRDKLAQELGVLCFEMEAAGLMNQIPCLVVRGICDYSDSHKNKYWQGYAALTAAIYTKLLLSRLKPRTLRQFEKSAKGEMTPEKKSCLRALFLTDPEEDKSVFKRRKGERAPRTCDWILDTNEVQEWLGIRKNMAKHTLDFIKGNFRSNLLWLYGNPGTGKSTMAITMAEELPKQPYFNNSKTLAYFFCDASAASRRTAISINQCFLRIDEDRDFRVHILITSRPYPEIGRHLNQFNNKDLSQYPRLATDLKLLIESKVNDLREKNRYSDKVATDVSKALEDKAEGTFLWVGIACTELASIRSRDALKTLHNLPRGLHSLYRALLDTALTHDSTDNQTILRMMSVMACSQRPLSVAELSMACNLYPDEDEESRLNFTHEDIEMCRLMVIVQDGIVRFLHKSVKDFLMRKGEGDSNIVDDLKAHAMLAYRCLNTWLDNYQRLFDGEIELFDVELLEYAANYWGMHARDAKSEFQIQAQHEKFFQAESNERNLWVMGFGYSPSGEAERFIPLHLAGLYGIVSLVEFAFAEIQRSLMFGQWRKAQLYDDIKFIDGYGQTPLQIAAGSANDEVMAVLLKRKVDKMHVRPQVIITAAANEEHGDHLNAFFSLMILTHGGTIFSLLLDRDSYIRVSQSLLKPNVVLEESQGPISWRIGPILMPPSTIGRPIITEGVLKAAVNNRSQGTAIMTKLIDLLGDKLDLNTTILESMCANLEANIVRLVLRRTQNQLPLTTSLLGAALRNRSLVDELVTVLLDECNCTAMASQEILYQICDYAGPGVIKRLLDQQENSLELTSPIASSVAQLNATKEDVIRISIERCEISHLHPPFLHICSTFGADIICQLLDKCSGLDITPPLIKAIAENIVSPRTVMIAVLRHSLTPKLKNKEICSICQNFDADVIRVLWSKDDGIELTMDIILSVHANKHRKKVISAILNTLGASYIPQEVIAMVCELFDSVVVELLVERQNGLELTVDIIYASSANEEYEKAVIISILCQSGHPPIKPELIELLCLFFDAEVLDHLKYVTISEAVVYAASENFQHGEEIMLVLLQKTGRLRIEPKAIAAAYEVFGRNTEIIALLQSHGDPLFFWIQDGQDLSPMLGYDPDDPSFVYKHYSVGRVATFSDNFKDTEAVTDAIKFAASNVVDARNVLLLLLDEFGHQVKPTEAMLEAAAANEYQGFDAMDVLLGWAGDNVAISEGIFRTAVLNQWSGRDLVQLILSRFWRQDFLTDGIFKAAFQNHEHGTEIITMLLEYHPGKTVHITQHLVRVAGATNAEKMLALLVNYPLAEAQLDPDAIATMCQLFSGSFISSLFTTHRDNIVITDAMFAAAATNCLQA